MKKPVAYLLKKDEIIVSLDGEFIIIDENFNYLPMQSELNSLVPINNNVWEFALKGKITQIVLNEIQERLIFHAFADREKIFNSFKEKINKMSVKDISPLFNTKKDKIFIDLSLVLTYFKALPENKEFRDELGFVLFNKELCFIKRFSPIQQENLINLYRKRFNQDPPEELKERIRECLHSSYDEQKRVLSSLKKQKLEEFFSKVN